MIISSMRENVAKLSERFLNIFLIIIAISVKIEMKERLGKVKLINI